MFARWSGDLGILAACLRLSLRIVGGLTKTSPNGPKVLHADSTEDARIDMFDFEQLTTGFKKVCMEETVGVHC